MWQFLFKRLAAAILVVAAASMLTFGILHLTPGDTPVTILKHAFIGIEQEPTDSEVTNITNRYKLDEPLDKQYFSWIKEAVRGNLGESYVYRTSVAQIIGLRFPATVLLALVSVALSLLIAIPVGVFSAARRNSVFDHLSRLCALFAVSIPSFWLALLLIIVFSLQLDLFSVAGFRQISDVVLPCVTIAAGMSAVTMRMMRSCMLEILNQDYILTAKAKGLHESVVVWRHALRNAFLPVITIVGLQFGHMLGGTVVVETVFAWPGLGKLLIDSILAKDIPMVQGIIVLIATSYAVVNLLVDLAYVLMDPRIRYGREV
ncbi:binding-protein-dependent transport systems inner membrane component [Desulfofarcimen acetoxidans DSM 771]|jgi:peptide/nickel transport system permease protein|uniref:Binding-protein-dependent transport systems inner membrane component n=1 Tax=Desulfofarcimen acetoxidans (strain ATCC 49208 / DSM 771 / KCTC 5769 / VKM B-1644 / 5575) TaxID=485916 RepID=C8W528_DESAS|nr:ABC transporter permease [Desulfofarcimen acetoxidans]ACV61380.1 binding-protein-dependent transport systems inner membrane component [Desulfofarcimen acetoxidans DSM 771]